MQKINTRCEKSIKIMHYVKKICINMFFKIWRDGTKKGYVKLYNLIK